LPCLVAVKTMRPQLSTPKASHLPLCILVCARKAAVGVAGAAAGARVALEALALLVLCGLEAVAAAARPLHPEHLAAAAARAGGRIQAGEQGVG
jgi:hypothetical protein